MPLDNFLSQYKGLEEWVLHVQWHKSLKTWEAVTTMGFSMRAELEEWVGMGSERWSVHKTVLEPICIVGSGDARVSKAH